MKLYAGSTLTTLTAVMCSAHLLTATGLVQLLICRALRSPATAINAIDTRIKNPGRPFPCDPTCGPITNIWRTTMPSTGNWTHSRRLAWSVSQLLQCASEGQRSYSSPPKGHRSSCEECPWRGARLDEGRWRRLQRPFRFARQFL